MTDHNDQTPMTDAEFAETDVWKVYGGGCPNCDGTGYDDGQCYMCGGTGEALDGLRPPHPTYGLNVSDDMDDDSEDLPF